MQSKRRRRGPRSQRMSAGLLLGKSKLQRLQVLLGVRQYLHPPANLEGLITRVSSSCCVDLIGAGSRPCLRSDIDPRLCASRRLDLVTRQSISEGEKDIRFKGLVTYRSFRKCKASDCLPGGQQGPLRHAISPSESVGQARARPGSETRRTKEEAKKEKEQRQAEEVESEAKEKKDSDSEAEAMCARKRRANPRQLPGDVKCCPKMFGQEDEQCPNRAEVR